MEKVNVLNGNGETTQRIVNELLESALKFYGKDYEDIIIQAIKEISFYEVGKHENMDLVIAILTGYMPKKESHNGYAGCFVYPKNPNSNNDYGDTILYRKSFKKEAYLTVAHELFGHGVCSRINRVVEKNGMIYNRNGIALHGIDNSEWRHRIINEGCVDYIAEKIVNGYGINVKTSDDYSAAKNTAKVMSTALGKKDFLKAMVTYELDLENAIDSLVYDGYFNELSLLNDKRHNYEENAHYLTSYVYKKKIQKQVKKMS